MSPRSEIGRTSMTRVGVRVARSGLAAGCALAGVGVALA